MAPIKQTDVAHTRRLQAGGLDGARSLGLNECPTHTWTEDTFEIQPPCAGGEGLCCSESQGFVANKLDI